MKTKLKIIFFCLLGFLENTNAQINKVTKLPTKYWGVSGYFNEIKSNLNKPENARIEGIQLQIQVMSPGNDPSDTNTDYWFSSYGNTIINVERSIGNGISLSKNSQVIYWFNDRLWNGASFRNQFYSGCCEITRTPIIDSPDLRPCSKDGYHPFSSEGIEKGNLTIEGSKTNLFNEWGWQIKTANRIGSILYGELTNGHTYSISYRFLPNLNVQ